MVENDPFSVIREAHTSAGNYNLGTEDILARLREWQSLCSFSVSAAGRDTITLAFETLPADLDSFVRELSEFCPDLIHQGAGSVPDVIKQFEESGQPVPGKLLRLIEGVNLEDENFALEIVKKSLQFDKKIKLWWD
jgi:hypothetical protein